MSKKSLSHNQIKLLEETIKSTIDHLIKENSNVTSLLANAFTQGDKKAIHGAASACLNSGLPRAKCDDIINSFLQKANDKEKATMVAQQLDMILDDPENWQQFGTQTRREREIGKLNI